MRRLALAAAAATLGWWLGILVGMTMGGAIGFLSSPLVGRALGGLCAGMIGGAIEARALPTMQGKRLRFALASAVATALSAMLLLDVQVMPWLVGGLFGAAPGAAQARAVLLSPRDSALRSATSSVAWSLGSSCSMPAARPVSSACSRRRSPRCSSPSPEAPQPSAAVTHFSRG